MKNGQKVLIIQRNELPDVNSLISTDSTAVWDEVIASARTWTIELDNTKHTCKMEYYYRRGNKHFLRGDIGKIVFEAEIVSPEFKIKKGQLFDVEFETQ